jgi:hypothetical protein
VVALAIAALGAGSTGSMAAASGGAVCKPLSTAGLKLQWSVIGTVTCSQAKPWLAKIVNQHGKPNAKAVITTAPKGFHCSASDDSKGRPAVGGCYTGTVKFPNNGFQWLG